MLFDTKLIEAMQKDVVYGGRSASLPNREGAEMKAWL
jgi:hypothetical protein